MPSDDEIVREMMLREGLDYNLAHTRLYQRRRGTLRLFYDIFCPLLHLGMTGTAAEVEALEQEVGQFPGGLAEILR